jgi:putative heme iron utilization protein
MHTLRTDADTLLRSRTYGVLSTLSETVPGHPFGSLVSYAVDGRGRPVFLLSRLALHTSNLAADARASFTVFDPAAEHNPQGAARLTVIGSVAPTPPEDAASLREIYLERHPEAEEYIDFGDFSFYRLEVRQTYFVGGLGRMGWIAPPE